jgi:hypothetical protein
MANFYEVPVQWKDGTKTQGRGIGNNAACNAGAEPYSSGPMRTCTRFRRARLAA